MNNVHFARNLVKGRIAETIFSQMFRDAGGFTVLEFGYEKVLPEIAQNHQEYDDHDAVVEMLKVAPDFAVINHNRKEVHLVEVKYRQHLDSNEVLRTAQKMHESWNPSYLFLATLDGFYLSSTATIIAEQGAITPLVAEIVPYELQDAYLKILHDFEQGN